MSILERNKDGASGITLIALVVTIIVLLILAGISINLIIGENGIIIRAREAQKAQEKAEELERLIMVIPEVVVKDDGKVDMDSYLEELENKGMIDPDETQTNPDGSKEVITDNGYVATIVDKGNGKIEVTIDGKVDNLPPKIIKIEGKGTTSEIEITVQAKRAEGAKYRYYYKENGTKEEYQKVEESSNNTCTIEGITQGKKYDIKVEVENKKGTAEGEITVTTGSLPEGTISFGGVSWNASTHKATVTVSTSASGYTLQYATSSSGPWTTIASGGRTTEQALNTTIYARLWDGTNATTHASTKITDGTAPTASIGVGTTNTTTGTKVNMTITHTDNQSGVNVVGCKWIYNTTAGNMGTNPASYTGGSLSSNPQTIQVSASAPETYYLHVLTVDYAGNYKETISQGVVVRQLVTGISLNPTTATVNVGSTQNISATITPSNASNKGVNWSSNNTSVATVNNGVVTAVGAGTATITATAQDGSGNSATCTITVPNPNVPLSSVSPQIGAYVKYISPSNSFTITASDSGLADSSDGTLQNVAQTFYPSNYTGLWRIMDNDTSTGIEIVSDKNVIVGASFHSNRLMFCDMHFGTAFRMFANGFVNTLLATGARTPSLSDERQLRAADLISIGEEYFLNDWVSSDSGDGENSSSVYYIDSKGIRKYNAFSATGADGDEWTYECESGMRPIITLKTDVKISGGTGTASDPYILAY